MDLDLDVPVIGFVDVGGRGEDFDPICDGGLCACADEGVYGRCLLTCGLSRLKTLSADMVNVRV